MNYPNFSFEILKKSKKSRARLGKIHTPHGVVETPNFIFCATKAAIKGGTPQMMREEGTQIILSNTYHLMLQPGSDLVRKMGGLHKFMGWDGPMLTDSGGFQIFSLGYGSVADEIKGRRSTQRPKTLLKISEEGAIFKSYLDGKKHVLTPEKSIQIQRDLGADLIVCFDECTPFHVDKSYTARSMRMSHRWGVRCLEEFARGADGTQALYGIIQGGVYPDLRQESVDFVNENPFFAHAIGGSLGANKTQMAEVVEMTAAGLSPERPIHLLGIGGITDIIHGISQGIDTFDCVHPTRIARHGGALVPRHLREEFGDPGKEHINIRNSRFKEDPEPIDPTCGCSTCKNFSRSYLHHLMKAKELLAMTAITTHNVHFMNRFMTALRQAMHEDRFEEEAKFWA